MSDLDQATDARVSEVLDRVRAIIAVVGAGVVVVLDRTRVGALANYGVAYITPRTVGIELNAGTLIFLPG